MIRADFKDEYDKTKEILGMIKSSGKVSNGFLALASFVVAGLSICAESDDEKKLAKELEDEYVTLSRP